MERTIRLAPNWFRLVARRPEAAPVSYPPRAPKVDAFASVAARIPPGGQYLSRTYSDAVGTRTYRLYIPASLRGGPAPLIVMLHGCTQSSDDFATGTRMNEEAEAHGCLVVYPEQSASANMKRCWNWFSSADQKRDSGEPSLIAGITRQVMRGYPVDARRVYICGLSAGGAAAAIMGCVYPDLYAAIGVHSGLPCGAAHDVPSAFAAMRGSHVAPRNEAKKPQTLQPVVPTIVFHGDQDLTVNYANAEAVVTQSGHGASLTRRTTEGNANGRAYSRTVLTNSNGDTAIEQWLIHGAGHAWSGGSPEGSHTSAMGPNASAEMLRFFLEHPRRANAN